MMAAVPDSGAVTAVDPVDAVASISPAPVIVPPIPAEMDKASIEVFNGEILICEWLIANGRPDEARERLLILEKARPDHSQILFLIALLDMAARDHHEAIRRLHRILVNEPEAVRVRLELGRAYFESGDYGNAERQFRFARAGNLPPSVVLNIDRYLHVIRGKKTLNFGLTISVAPDSNLNAGPATDTITLYGIPFQLSQDAKASSGVGLTLAANAEWAPRLSSRMKLRVGAQAYRAQYRQSNFNDMTVTSYVGPRLNLRRWEFNLLGNVGRRWYGGKTYTNIAGVGADATYFINTRMGLGAGFNFNHFEYPRNPDQTGNGRNLAFSLFYTPTPSSIVRASMAIGRQEARIASYANHSFQIGLNYTREFKGGITLGLAPTYSRIGYDAPLAAFDIRRIDRQYTGQATLLYRRLDLGGFTPRIVYTYTRNDSSIPLYSFSRSRWEIGFTTAF
jgi:hypothetical protein